MAKNYNAADKQAIGEAKQRSDNLRAQRNADMKKMMNEPWGRRLLWHWLSQAGLYNNAFTGNSETYFRLGRQQAGQNLLAEIVEADPEAYANLLLEFKPKDDEG